MKLTKKHINNLTYKINGAIIEVHKILGSGLLESIYKKCLMHELKLRNISFLSEANLIFGYKDLDLFAYFLTLLLFVHY